jgi:signal transduction histidine kinase
MSLTQSSPPPQRVTAVTTATATFEEVDVRGQLDERPRRLPNHRKNHHALGVLAGEMADNPRNMLQKLVEIAVDLCDADTAGISLLDGDVFRWVAVAGVFASYRGGTMPRDESPCGVCIDRDTTQLMYLPDRCFPALLAEPRFVEALLIPFHDHGKAVGTVWVVSHTNERKFDKEDEQIVRTLAQFASAGWQLWKTLEAAEEAGRRKDDFLATLGHELRNPVGAIATAATIIQRHVSEPAGNRAIEIISRQCRHMSRLVEDLLDVARIGTGKLELQKQPVDLRTIIEQTIETRRAQIENRGHRLTIEFAPGPVTLHADPVRLTQLLSNVLDNAVKYTPPNGDISIVVSSNDGEASIEVRDTGIGIPPAQLHTIFDRFTQLQQAGDSVEGLGLGLTLVRSLTELHGGTVVAASGGPGQGSSFTIRLPIGLTDVHPARLHESA